MLNSLKALDLSVFHFFNNFAGQSPIGDQAIIFFGSYLAYILIVVFFVHVAFSRHEKLLKIEILATTLIASFFARFVVTEGIRYFIHRPRPFLTLHLTPLFTDPAWSFPSGHATFFFALATAMYLYDKRWGIGYFVGAILICMGRIAAGVHYPSDILVGALVGIAVALATFSIIRPLAEKRWGVVKNPVNTL